MAKFLGKVIYIHCPNFSLPVLSWIHASEAYVPNTLLKMLLLRSPKASILLNPMLNSLYSSCLTSHKLWDLDDCPLFETFFTRLLGRHTLLSLWLLPSVSFAGSYSSPRPQLVAVFPVSILGPFLFSIHTPSLDDIIQSQGLKYHWYADPVGSQIYIFRGAWVA